MMARVMLSVSCDSLSVGSALAVNEAVCKTNSPITTPGGGRGVTTPRQGLLLWRYPVLVFIMFQSIMINQRDSE